MRASQLKSLGKVCSDRGETASAKALGWYLQKKVEGASVVGTGMTERESGRNLDR